MTRANGGASLRMQRYAAMDALRRARGAGMDALGLGPQSLEAEVIARQRGYRLLRYGDDGRPLLLVPSPIKRSYLWDLAPGHSVVRAALAAGFSVYLVDWESPAAPDWGLDRYAGSILGECQAAVTAEAGAPAIMIGHSLGGTLAALFAAAQPAALPGLVLLEAPLHFCEGAFAPLLQQSPALEEVLGEVDFVPGSFLSAVSMAAAPDAFAWERWEDLLASLGDVDATRTHLRALRWTYDERPMARRLFEQVVDDLYRHDRFMRGELRIEGAVVGPESVRAPLVAVADPASRVIPERAVSAFVEHAASVDKLLLHYHGDRGVGIRHLGVLIGDSAQRRLWPQIFERVRSWD